MSEWININFEDIELIERKRKKKEVKTGIQLNLYISPYDIPDAVRGYYDKKNRKFVIEFSYIGKEKIKDKKLNDDISLGVGINSNRIYKIYIDINYLNDSKNSKPKTVKLNFIIDKLNSAIDNFSKSIESKYSKLDNYNVVKGLLEKKIDKIYEHSAYQGV